MLRFATLAALICALSASAATDRFDMANRYLAESSFKRACAAFTEYLKGADPALAREAKVKRFRACARAGIFDNANYLQVEALAKDTQFDWAQALAAWSMLDHARGDRPKALDGLERVYRQGGKRESAEARVLYIQALFEDLANRYYQPAQTAQVSDRILAADPSALERDQAVYARARVELGPAATQGKAIATLEELGRGKGEMADDALYLLGSFYEGRQDFVSALAHYDQVTRRFLRAKSNVAGDAANRAAQIRQPIFSVSGGYVDLPGATPRINVNFRNLTQARYRVVRLNPLRQDAAKVLASNEQQMSGEEARSWTEKLTEPAPFHPGSAAVDLKDLPAGLYRFEATAGALSRSAIVHLTGSTSVLKVSSSEAVVFTADAMTGAGVAGADVTVYAQVAGGRARLTGTSDAKGLCRLPFKGNSGGTFIAWSGKDGSYAMAQGYSGGWYSSPAEYLAYALSDRPLYKPAEQVGVKVFVRRRQVGPTEPVEEATLTLSVYDPQGREVKKARLVTNRFGTAALTLDLPKDAALGLYRLVIGGTGARYFQQGYDTFRVEEYKPPEYTVSVEAARPPKLGEPVKVKVSASFFFGGPVANAQGRAVITAQGYYHSWAPWPDEAQLAPGLNYQPYWYGYGYDRARPRPGLPYRAYPGYQPVLASNTVQFKTGDDGTAELEVPDSAKAEGDRSYQVQVFVTDASRREVSGEGKVNVAAAPYFVDLRPDRFLYKPGERIAVRLRAEDANGQKASPKVRVRLSRIEDQKTVKVVEVVAALVAGDGVAQLDGDALGPVRIEVFPETATPNDAPLASTDVWLTNDAKPMIPPNADFMLLADGRAPFDAGQTLRALVVTPREGGDVLVTVENERIHYAQVVEVKGRARFIELPLTSDMAPNAWIGATRVENLTFFTRYAPVRLRGEDTTMKVQVAWPKEQTEPGTSLPLTVTLSGNPARAETSVAVVDEALFALQPERTDLQDFFGRRARSLTVTTTASLQFRFFRPQPGKPQAPVAQALPDGLEALASAGAAPEPASRAEKSPLADRAPSAKPASAPGGVAPPPMAQKSAAAPVAGPAPDAKPVKVRTNFSSSAGWFSSLEGRVGVAQTAQVKFPDSLTSWRAIAIAVTDGPQLGVGRAVVRTQKPLMVRLQAPRFFTERDEVTLSGLVTSRLAEAAKVEVSFDAPGLKVLGPATQAVDVPAGADVRVDARFAVVEAGSRKVRVTARGPGAADAMEWTLPAVVHGSAQRKVFAGRLSEGTTLELPLPDRRNAAGTELELTLSPSLAAVMFDALPYLNEFPYGCTEQTLSRFVPAAIAQRAAKELRLPPHRVPKDLDVKVEAGLKRLYGFQHADGGWGWWKDDQSDLWMTAYVVYGLSLGKEAGLEVSPAVVKKGRAFLEARLGDAEKQPDVKAWLVYALARTGGAPKAALDSVFEARTTLSPRGRALVALSLLAAKDDRARVAVENLDDLVKAAGEAKAVYGGNPYDAYASSETIENTAYALMAIAKYDARSKLIGPLIDFLMTRRQGGRWQSTRDTAFVVYALSEVALREKAADSSGALVVSVNGKEVQRVAYQNGGMNLLAPVRLRDAAFKPGANVVQVKREGAGTGWFSATWDVYNQDENLTAVANEVSLTRKYTLLGKVGGPKARAEAEYGMVLESGDRVLVELEISAKKPVQYVMVEDLKAAGLEAVLQQSGPEVCRYQCTHAELRPDRVAMFFSYLNVGTTKVSYELRAEVPGRFHALPARLEAMYAPEQRATSGEMRLEVRDARGPLDGVAAQ
jgi:uncharacterized protein YfaS (alpha-2-macroglobulin family)